VKKMRGGGKGREKKYFLVIGGDCFGCGCSASLDFDAGCDEVAGVAEALAAVYRERVVSGSILGGGDERTRPRGVG
jgi:hypothetical protein